MENKIYKIGRIYKITSPHTDKVYIGSTIQTLEQRLAKHKNKYNSYSDGKYHYVTSFDILKAGNYSISLIKEFENITKKELEREEGEITKNTTNSCNKLIAGRTDQEYYEDNKEKRIQQMKQYTEKNKDVIREYKKQYREKNKEIIREKREQYYQMNKEKVRAQNSEKIQCECGLVFTRVNKAKHMRTKKHIERMEELEKSAIKVQLVKSYKV